MDLLQDLEGVLNTLGWSALPVWARCVSVAYAAAILAYGNVAAVRNVWNALALTLRGALRVGGGLARWWAKPSRSAQMQTELAKLSRQMEALMAPVHTAPVVTRKAG